ncbi:MAG: hypothetical protein ACE5ID_04105, partial [Acidobacteriota bacterium]
MGGLQLVRATWMAEILGSADLESRWNRVLHDGLLEAPPPPSGVLLKAGAVPEIWQRLAAPPAAADGMELTFHLSAAVHDGRYAGNGWLQELPDPITKLTWDNAALISPATS